MYSGRPKTRRSRRPVAAVFAPTAIGPPQLLVFLVVKRVADFHFLVDKLTSKLQGWKAKLLSQAGITTLISSVLQSIPLYTFSCFKVPDTICKKLDSIVRDFWWVMIKGLKKNAYVELGYNLYEQIRRGYWS